MLGGAVPTPSRPAPDTSQPKPLRPVEWLEMIVLGTVLSLSAYIAVAFLGPGVPLEYFWVIAVPTLAIGTFAAGRILGWHGSARWIAAFCLIVLSAIAFVLGLAFLGRPHT